MVGEIRQRDYADCGVCCIASIGRYYNYYWNILDLKILANTKGKAISLLNLRVLASRLNFESLSVKSNKAGLKAMDEPVIALVKNQANQGHFVVVKNLGKQYIEVMDPIKGLIIRHAFDSWIKN